MKSVKTGSVGKINSIMEHKMDVTLSIWGASTALVNFNPKLIEDSLHISTFNMGIDGTNIDQYNGLLKEYLSYTKKSKLLIIAIDIYGGLAKRNKFYELQNWIHHIDNNNIYNCFTDIDASTMFKVRYIPFYSITLFNKHAFPIFYSTLNHSESEYQFSNLGYYPQLEQMNSQNDDKSLINVEIDKNILEKLRSSCLLALSKNILPIVVITPCYYKGLGKIKNKDEFYKQINFLKNEKIIVYDFSDTTISKDSLNFKNYSHLNSTGANKLTNMLIQNIKNIQ